MTNKSETSEIRAVAVTPNLACNSPFQGKKQTKEFQQGLCLRLHEGGGSSGVFLLYSAFGGSFAAHPLVEVSLCQRPSELEES